MTIAVETRQSAIENVLILSRRKGKLRTPDRSLWQHH